MAARANRVKLGLFIILGAGAAIVFAIMLGTLHLNRETSSYVTYFTESVQGLDVGAPVKARGVTIGRVGNITFAPDQQMVEVRSDLDVSTMKAMGLTAKRPPPDVRAQLASQGLVGARFLSLDLADPAANPPPALTFTPPEKYIPARRSVQKSLEDSATKTLERLAELMDTIVREHLPEKVAQAVGHAGEAFSELDGILNRLDREKLPGRAAKMIEDARVALDSLDKALARVDEVGRNANTTTRDFGATLDDVRSTSAAIRSLAEELERNPDMLVKGYGRRRSP